MKTLQDVFDEGDKQVGFEKTDALMDYILRTRPQEYNTIASITKHDRFVQYVHEELDGFIGIYNKYGGQSD